MSTVVYLANKQLQIVVGTEGTKKVTLKNSYLAFAPEGSIINGIIMDTELFTEFIKNLWETEKLPKKDVILVVNSNKFSGKKIEMPSLNDSKTLEFIEREFSDVRREGESVYSYIPLSQSDGKMKKYYVESIPTDFLNDYIEIFGNAGVKVKAIYSGESSLIGFTRVTIGKKYKTFALQMADSMIITTLLWVNGEFYYFNSTRCFHDQGTEDYANDIARSISQIIQFMQANQIEFPLESIILAGIEPNMLSMYQNALEQHGITVPAELFETDAIVSESMNIQNILYATSGLFVNGKWQNFLKRLTQRKKKKTGDKVGTKDIILVVAVLTVMLIALASCITYKIIKQKELDEINEYNESPIVIAQTAAYDMLSLRISFLQEQYDSVVGLDENINTYPVCNKSVIDVIEKCADGYATITYNSFDAQAGIVSINATAAVVEDINKFIKRLTEENVFYLIDYSGYTYIESSNKWNINVVCTLAESAGR